MPVVRKVKSKKEAPKVDEKVEPVEAEVVVTDDAASAVQGRASGLKARDRKGCRFCLSRTEPVYFEATTLRRFITDRGRIIPRARCGNCAKHQRRLSKQIKYARHLSLLPFLVRA